MTSKEFTETESVKNQTCDGKITINLPLEETENGKQLAENLEVNRNVDKVEKVDKDTTLTKLDRSSRFVETSNRQLAKSQNLNDLKSFYQGDFITERMTEVRKPIHYIRENWSQVEQMLGRLEKFLKDQSAMSDKFRQVFARRRNWCDLDPQSDAVEVKDDEEVFSSIKYEFDIINTYTHKDGFNEIFKIADGVFRSDESVNYQDRIYNAVFLIELINIDLFNYVHKFPHLQGFEGIVYRGMAVPPGDFEMFEKLMEQHITKRYISIPLGLWSSSLSLNVAVDFVKEKLERCTEPHVPLLMKIHVRNLDQDLLDTYRRTYSDSVVSSISAVDISALSEFQEEQEVLLRGGYYQTLNFYKETISGLNFHVLELVMLNTNRDHYSNPVFLAERDGEARAMFRNMVELVRNRYCMQYCENNQLVDDASMYREATLNNKKILEKLIN